MAGNTSVEEAHNIDWTTDDELEILSDNFIPSPPSAAPSAGVIAANGEAGIVSVEECDNIDWTTDDELEILSDSVTPSPPTAPSPPIAAPSAGVMVGHREASTSTGIHHSKLVEDFVRMGFPIKLVMEVIEENGEDPNLILSVLLTYNDTKESPQERLQSRSDPSSSDYNENCFDDFSDMDSWSENENPDDTDSMSEKHKRLLSLANTGSLSDKDKKLLDLANMGYTVEEASIAMERCGPEASVAVLTDFILAAQMAREEDCYLPEDDLKPRHLLNGDSRNKKRKYCQMSKRKNDMEEETIRLPNPMIGFGVPSMPAERGRRILPEEAKGPPYFYYENVALAPKGVWDTISRFLYDVEPEFVDSKYFCACARKRGYVHNLPIENRRPLMPPPNMTILQAFPLSKKWWPSWDTRDKLNCIQTAIGSAKLTERIRTLLERYDGNPPEPVQRYILDQCRKWNLVWVGRNKVAVLEPDEVEVLLGFPRNHTRGGGISRTDRYKSLGNSFQVDTVAYHLSVLKDIFPNGINVLSLFSGIGGAEVALHRLGIRLKSVVSVEKSKANRDIVRSWWEQTNQIGNLIDFEDVTKIDDYTLGPIISKIGGFDLVVGGSPCNNLAGSNRVSRDGLEGKESQLFYEYFRILELVKALQSNRQV